MKQITLNSPVLIAGVWKFPEDGPIEVEDLEADKIEADGMGLIDSHNGVPVVWGGCCCAHHDSSTQGEAK